MVKKALLVGINSYRRPISTLRGCLNDVAQLQEALQKYYQYPADNIRVLLDAQATRKGMLESLDWLVQGSQTGDVLLFHYSGHGGQVDDDSDDEWECRDEILISYDHDWDNPLRDDHLKFIFDTVPLGTNLTIIIDSCHSGTINKDFLETEVPRTVFIPREVQERIAAKVAKRNVEYRQYVVSEYRELARVFSAAELDAKIDAFLAKTLERFKVNRFDLVNTRQNNILLAGCQDTQTSADAFIDGDWHGAFTFNLIKAIKEAKGSLTYEQLIEQTGATLRDYQQVPQLECPTELKKLPFLMPFPN